MATRQQLIKRCKELGAYLFDGGDCLRIDLPKGKRFEGGDIHYLDIYLTGWKKADTYTSLFEDLEQMTIEDCDTPDCDCCSTDWTPESVERLYNCTRIA